MQKKQDVDAHSIVNAFDSFNSSVSSLDANYKELKQNIQALNLQMSEQNKQLEEDFYKVNQLRWFFDSILNSMTSGMVVIDPQGVIVLFNNGAQKMTGFTGEEVLGRPYKEVFAKGFSQRFSPLYTLNEGRALNLEEKQLQTKSGQPVPVRYSTALVTEGDQKVLGVVEVFSDLSRIKRLEKEMLQIKTQTALNQMAALVAHEVRNPLGGIRGYVDLIAESFDKDDPRLEMVGHVNESIIRLDEIVANFNHFTRPVKPYFEETDVVSYMRDVLGYFLQQDEVKEAGVNILHNFDSITSPLNVTFDPILIEQALMSILNNAMKANVKNSDIRVELKIIKKSGKDRHEYAAISIIDHGIGMSKDVLQQLFTPFFTTREQGLGLGLALAKNFIGLHHGDILIESELAAGTTVTIMLPKH
ncbi:PAS domain S-box protein [bacterium]|nr:PAS domain S-box protein [bacterium]